MTTAFFSVIAASLYFGWLWHDCSAKDHSEDDSPGQPLKDSNRQEELNAQRACFARIYQSKIVAALLGGITIAMILIRNHLS